MQRSPTALFTVTALTLAMLGSGSPVAAQTSGTVGATLTVADASACLTVTQTAVSYLATLEFSGPGSGAAAKSSPLYAIDNCGSVDIDVSVRGTAATATDPAVATWGLTGDPSFTTDCTALDVYAVDVEADGGTVGLFEMLTPTDQVALTLPGGATATNISHDLWMPCEGSAGAGETMSFDVLYTAVAVDEAPALAGEVVINEIQRAPVGVPQENGEWFEVHNPGGTDVDIHGWTIQGPGGGEFHTINTPDGALVLPAGGFLVLGNNADPGLNGGVPVDYQYGGIFLLMPSDFIELRDGADLMDRVAWDGSFPAPTDGSTISLLDPALPNEAPANWCASVLNTPGATNSC